MTISEHRIARLRKALQSIIDDDDSDPISTTIARDAIRLDNAVCADLVLVPREPTKKMLEAAMPHMDSYSSNLAWWAAMLKAAQE